MVKFSSRQLLESLENDVKELVSAIREIENTNLQEVLLKQPSPDKWSIAQVIEHLNSYNRYYLSEMEKTLERNKDSTSAPLFRPGWLGNYFTRLMKPGRNGKPTMKLRSPKDHRPKPNLDAGSVCNEFYIQERRLIELLQEAKKINIGKARVPISISRIIQLKLGDTFRFLVAHQQRHLVQIKGVLAQLKNNTAAVMLA